MLMRIYIRSPKAQLGKRKEKEEEKKEKRKKKKTIFIDIRNTQV
jgi:hypothetical protein